MLGVVLSGILLVPCIADQAPQPAAEQLPAAPKTGRAAESLPRIPNPDAKAVQLPAGYRAHVVLADLTYPTSVEFDDEGRMYVAEGGFIYGDDIAPARILRVLPDGGTETVSDSLEGPVTDLLWHDKRLYISHRGKISVLEAGSVRDLVTDLPSRGDHHNNQLAIGPDGMLYFGQGTATNSGIVGIDNFKTGWLAKYPEVHDVPARDIRLSGQSFETPNPLVLLADQKEPKPNEHAGHEATTSGQKVAEGHQERNEKETNTESGHEGHGTTKKPEQSETDGSEKHRHEGHAGESAKNGIAKKSQLPFALWELHPMLTHFPIAFLLGGVVLDLFAWRRRRLDYAQVATGLMIAGVISGVFTALAGLLALFTVPAHTPEAHALMYWHLGVQSTSLLLFGSTALLRWRRWTFPPSFGARLTGFIGALALAVGSGLGGYIVYHGGAGIEPDLLSLDVRQSHHHAAGSGEQPEESPDNHEAMKQNGSADNGKGPSQGNLGKDSIKEMDRAGDGMKGMKPMAGMNHGSAEMNASHQEKSVNHGTRETVQTFAFQPFGKTPPDDGAMRGTIKANGTILRMKPDGSDLEVYAWGLRNPFGLAWGSDGTLYASDNGYDERGSRPIAHAPDCLWTIKKDAWYGFPDYAGGVPVTDERFWPEGGPIPKALMRDEPPVETPLVTLEPHIAAAKLALSRNEAFGFPGQLFLALAGDMNPVTGSHEERSGFEVVRIEPKTAKTETFFKAKQSSLGSKGMEYVATAGPRRPVDVQFSPDGTALYVVDIGAMAVVETATGLLPRPFPRTGVVWRITRD